MARARNIKPGFFRNENLVELPYETRLLFIGLWTIADREGRLEDRPKRIKMELFPADNLDVDQCLNQLQGSGFIERYTVEESQYIQILTFTRHQNPHQKEQASTIPAPPSMGTGEDSTGQAPVKSGADTGQAGLDSLNTDSLNTDSPFSEGVAGADAPDPRAADEPEPSKPEPNKPMPRNGPAQTMLAVLHEDILKTPPPTDYGRAVKKADALVKAGCRQREFQEIVKWMLSDPWYADKGVTIFTIFDARDKYLAAKSRPGGLTIHQGGKSRPSNGEAWTEEQWAAWRRERGITQPVTGSAPAFDDDADVIEAKARVS